MDNKSEPEKSMRKKIKREGPTRPWQEGMGAKGEPKGDPKSRSEYAKINHSEELPLLPTIARAISAFGKVYNSFEANGTERIPQQGPALIVFYHGLVPLDAWYFGLQFFLERGRMIHGLGDRWMFRIPGVKQLVESIGVVEGTPEAARKLLGEGRLVGVSPGGVREAISGYHNNYRLLWKDRIGFAKIALDAKVDIIPGFSENVEELYRAPLAGSHLLQGLYEKTRLPIVPIMGLGALPFPVKVRTWIGEPIRHDPRDTPEMLAEKTRIAIEGLIGEHQRRHMTIFEALKQRFKGPTS